MPKKIEEVFNDCFDRLLSGESLESCLSRYPEHAAELHSMLSTAFDVKRRAYPIQPRPEFKYWARVRLQGVQDYVSRQPVKIKPSIFSWQRSWAVALAAILVFVLASGGTAAASSEALPDQPLYGVKLAVEQTRVALTFSDIDKAELHAQLAEKRAQEIAIMANQGKTDKITSTIARMNYQLEQTELSLQKYNTGSTGATGSAATTAVPPAPTITSPVKPSTLPAESQTPSPTTPPSGVNAARAATDVNRAKTAINASAAKSLTLLQNALDKAPASAKPTLNELIERTKRANEKFQIQPVQPIPSTDQKPVVPNIRPDTGLPRPPPDISHQDPDKTAPFFRPDKPKTNIPSNIIPPPTIPKTITTPVQPVNPPPTINKSSDVGLPVSPPSGTTRITLPVSGSTTDTNKSDSIK